MDQPNNPGAQEPGSTPPSSLPTLRSQGEFFMTGVGPVGPQPKGSNCSICTEHLTNDVVSLIGACSHMFHTACLLAWLSGTERQNRTCPNCRCELYAATTAANQASNPSDPARIPESFVSELNAWAVRHGERARLALAAYRIERSSLNVQADEQQQRASSVSSRRNRMLLIAREARIAARVQAASANTENLRLTRRRQELQTVREQQQRDALLEQTPGTSNPTSAAGISSDRLVRARGEYGSQELVSEFYGLPALAQLLVEPVLTELGLLDRRRSYSQALAELDSMESERSEEENDEEYDLSWRTPGRRYH